MIFSIRSSIFLILIFITLCIPVSCTEEDDDSSNSTEQADDDSADDDDDDTSDPLDQVEVQWAPCSLYDGQDDGRAECASTQMPFDWMNPDGRTFTSYAKRLLSWHKSGKTQLWLLHGGPGASGTIDLPVMMEYIQDDYPELDIYTLDPRGSGYSEYVGCPDQEDPNSELGEYISLDEMPNCIDWLTSQYGDDLGVFNVTNSAVDLAAYIHHAKSPGKNVMIWGGSGGTFWGQRYLQLYPDQADGIILEGIVPPNESLVFQDEYNDKIGRAIFDLCAEDSFCSGKMPVPETTFINLLDKLDNGHCSTLGIDSDFVIEMINYLGYYHPHHATIPAFVYRVDRCNTGDMEAIVTFYNRIFGGSKLYNGLSFSYVLFYNEVCSELWDHQWFEDNDALLDYLDDVYDGAILGSGMGYDRNSIYLMWPKYSDPLDDTWANTDIPMLMLQGVLDPSTPYDFAKDLEENFNGEHQHFIAFPYATHNVASGTPVSSDTSAEHCGQKLFIDFLKNPSGPLDTSCVDQTLPLDFEGTSYAAYFFGTEDYWENEPSKKDKITVPTVSEMLLDRPLPGLRSYR